MQTPCHEQRTTCAASAKSWTPAELQRLLTLRPWLTFQKLSLCFAARLKLLLSSSLAAVVHLLYAV